jgi:hypothetical protein
MAQQDYILDVGSVKVSHGKQFLIKLRQSSRKPKIFFAPSAAPDYQFGLVPSLFFFIFAAVSASPPPLFGLL